jgi:hypothetical protein
MAQAVSAFAEHAQDEEAKRAEFLQKRKAHYNEFRVLKGSGSSDSERETG